MGGVFKVELGEKEINEAIQLYLEHNGYRNGVCIMKFDEENGFSATVLVPSEGVRIEGLENEH